MACDCDALNNRLRRLEDDVRRLQGGRSGGSAGNSGGNDDLIERVFKHKKWLLMERVLTMIYQGNQA